MISNLECFFLANISNRISVTFGHANAQLIVVNRGRGICRACSNTYPRIMIRSCVAYASKTKRYSLQNNKYTAKANMTNMYVMGIGRDQKATHNANSAGRGFIALIPYLPTYKESITHVTHARKSERVTNTHSIRNIHNMHSIHNIHIVSDSGYVPGQK
jgi:hypothetical protein